MPALLPIGVREVVKQYERLKTERGNWDSLWQELSDYVLPRKSFIQDTSTIKGEKQTEKLFDSTAPHALEMLAAAMQGSLTSAAIRWFTLRMREPELNKIEEVREWLDESANRMFIAIQQSNFNAEIQESYLDIGCFGTSNMFVGKTGVGTDLDRLRFQTIPPGTYVIMENAEGIVDAVYYEFELTLIAAAEKFGEQNLSKDSRERIKSKPEEKIKILHAVFKRDGVSEDSVELTTPARKLPWTSMFIELNKSKKKISESGFFEFPFVVPRWAKASGEQYGRSPAMTALPDIRTLNKATDLRLRAWAKAIDPPLKVRDRGVIGRVRMTPRSINSVRDMDAIQEMITQARFDVANFQEENLKDSIRKIFFSDQIQFPPMEGTPASATEISIRFELMQRILGPTLGRLQSEALSPIVNRVFRMMLRAGELPEIPGEVLEAVGDNRAQIDIEYEGPLARAQRASDIETVNQVLASLVPLKDVWPEITDIIDEDKLARGVAERAGLPAAFIRGEREIEQIRDKRSQEIARQNQIQETSSLAEAAGRVAPALKALDEIQGSAQGDIVPGVPSEEEVLG